MPCHSKRSLFVILVFIALCLLPLGGQALESATDAATLSGYFQQSITQEDAAEDLKYLYDEVVRHHPFVRTTQSVFRALYLDTVAALPPKTTALDFFRAAAKLVTSLECGHSALFPSRTVLSTLNNHNAFFPLGVFVRDGAMVVTGNYYDPDIPKGAQILSINGQPVDSLLQTLMPYVPSDSQNVSRKEYLLSTHFYYFYTLFTVETSDYSIQYADPESGETRSYETKGRKQSQIEYALPDAGYDTYFTLYPSYAKIVIGSFALNQKTYQETYALFDSFFQAVDREHIDHVIVDVRGNSGGDPYISAYFLRYILPVQDAYFQSDAWGYDDLEKTQPKLEPHYTGTLYVLMDGGCFSTTGHFLSKIKDQDFALLIGEPSGATWLATDGSIFRTLPNTLNEMKLSTAAYATLVHSDFGLGAIQPDIAVTPEVDDILHYKDTIYQYVLSELILKTAP